MTQACFHCGEPVPSDCTLTVRANGVDAPVCCRGCEAAATWIQGLGLSDYYRLRSEPAERAEPLADFSAWDRPAMARLHVRMHADDRAEVVVLVDGMRCAACGWLIERALGAESGVCEVGVNAPARRVRLVFDPRDTPLSHLLTALARLGYDPHPLDLAALDALRQRESRDALKRLVVAGLGTMQAMMYAVALYAGHFDGMDVATRDFFRWLGFLVTTPVVLYAARPFFAGALRELRARHVSMDTPVALAIALIYLASLIATLGRGGEIYFDSVSMFVLFLLGARYVEMRARHRAGDLVDALARLQPATAERLIDGDRVETVGVHELETGDRVRVSAGAGVPADGVLLDGPCQVDESLLTGESTPRRHVSGDTLMAGTLLQDGPVQVRVTQVGADTVLAGIVRMITRAASDKPALARAADAHARRFVTRTLALTVLTALAWSVFDPSRAFDAAIAVLVISCPCAFALAVPAALTRAVAVLARRGVLVVDGDALERLAGVDTVVFDKTGTLTVPRLDRARSEAVRGELEHALHIAAALEQSSTHPLARALRSAADEAVLPTVHDRHDTAGCGVEGVIDGVRYRLGRADWTGESRGDERLVLRDERGTLARFALRECPRTEAASTVSVLREAGLRVILLSGDRRARVARIAEALGIETWRAEATPTDKLDNLKQLRREGRVVAMVGDGINDAPVLAGADVAIALGSGAALAQASSGLLLAGDRLDRLLDARAVAREMLQATHRNLRWAIGYNLAAVPLAAFGLVPPWLAAIGMSASSLLVLLQSLRIGRHVSTQATTKSVAPTPREALA
ncbi:heavy metal translocating P-type ATPase [Oleiagrimonas citrea]|uniref:Cadmium-translocating P-type ATPase n=1 Tax=Oleiagrimonas citrea TaxID=1665687 RepID=A0A846ZJW9_9GAMM|nr:heavy metal translocating P-type ATPase [Oleiagrimonas citrea]NKZ37859.1 cadmium-translocating P-type ATPase [Oleiagrimonas citrea]